MFVAINRKVAQVDKSCNFWCKFLFAKLSLRIRNTIYFTDDPKIPLKSKPMVNVRSSASISEWINVDQSKWATKFSLEQISVAYSSSFITQLPCSIPFWLFECYQNELHIYSEHCEPLEIKVFNFQVFFPTQNIQDMYSNFEKILIKPSSKTLILKKTKNATN